MSLDPRIRTFLEQAGLLTPPGSAPRAPEVLLEEMRANDEKAKIAAAQAAAALPVACVEDRAIPGPAGAVSVRLYVPEGRGPFPVLLYLAAACWLTGQAAQSGGDPARLAVCGASGGGNFAAAIALMCRDRGGPSLCFQVLLVPVLDFDLTTPSWQNYDGCMIYSQEFLLVRNLYAPNVGDHIHPYAAPLLAPDLHGLPSTLIITAECDPVRDSGERYGRRLQEAGVSTSLSRYGGVPHGFMGMRALTPLAEQALGEAVSALRGAFAERGPLS
jgi:acetyl esterase